MSDGNWFAPAKRLVQKEDQARDSHPWAVSIVAAHFTRGLNRVFERAFVAGRWHTFVIRNDPVYVTLLQGMADEGLGRILVGNWAVAHTLATQSRFWLEDAIIDLLIARPQDTDVPPPRIYSLRMLADGWYSSGVSVWNVGERWREQLHGRGAWRPLVQQGVLEEVERVVGEEERRYEAELTAKRRHGDYSPAAVASEEDDRAALARMITHLTGPATPIAVRCNLLFFEPEVDGGTGGAWAIRYINPTTFNQSATIRAERVNLLRLYAWLIQEKPFRSPNKIRVVAADLIPRSHGDDAGQARSRFSPATRWVGEQLWEFIGVPFAAVTAGIRDAGASMRKHLREEIHQLLLE